MPDDVNILQAKILYEFVQVLSESLDIHVFGGTFRSGMTSVVVADTMIFFTEIADAVNPRSQSRAVLLR